MRHAKGFATGSKWWNQSWVIPTLLVILTVVLYQPGIHWGLPQGTTRDTLKPWGPDEIAPLSPIFWTLKVLTGKGTLPMKYPLFHYLFVTACYAPYLLFQLLTGKLAHPAPKYPFGFTDPAASLQTLTLIAREVSVLMGAGTVVAAYFTAKTLWNRTAGVLAGIFVMLMYPMFYYGKTSNVDVPALFWCSLVFLLAARTLREGWSLRRAVWMGASAALAVATKDQSYAVLLLLGLALVPFHLRALRAKGRTDLRACLKAPAAGLLASVGVYVVATGLVSSPASFRHHLDFVRTAWVGNYPSLWYFRYSDTWEGYLGLLGESFRQIADSLGWPLFLAACAGILICAWRERPKLVFLLTFPLLFLGVILPVRHTAIRFMFPLAFVLALFAAHALTAGLETNLRWLRASAWLVIIAGCSLSLLRAADLVYLLLNDPRYEASAWLKRYARPGDRLEYFESVTGTYRIRICELPYVPPGVQVLDGAVTTMPGARKLDGDFAITIGPEDQELHWFCPARIYAGLKDGSLGYVLGASIQRPSLFPHPHLNHHVNPRVEIFVRRDRAVELGLNTGAAASR